MANRQVTVSEVFETGGFTSYQLLVCFLCFFVMVLDGFDLFVIGVALPKMAAFLHVKPGALGLALSAGQFGPLVGSVALGMLGDRWGRKGMLLLSALFFGIFSIMTAYITSPGELALYRFLAGLGLGGAVPNALTFGSEYAPARLACNVRHGNACRRARRIDGGRAYGHVGAPALRLAAALSCGRGPAHRNRPGSGALSS